MKHCLRGGDLREMTREEVGDETVDGEAVGTVARVG